jgi:hypothetical protein
MRPLLLSLLFALTYAADLEQITTTDGRRFIGYYDGEAQTMTIEGPPKAVVRIPRDQVVERAAYIRPEEKDPVKRDEAALVKIEAERLAAIGEAARLFKYAEGHSGKEAETARLQASERMSHADDLAKKAEAVKARVEAAKGAKVAPASATVAKPAAEGEASSKPAQAKAGADPRAEFARALAEAEAEYLEKQLTAGARYLSEVDTSESPEIKDPRQSEKNEADRISARNALSREFVGMKARVGKAKSIEEKRAFMQKVNFLLVRHQQLSDR